MKKFSVRLVIALVVCALSGSMALAAKKVKSSIVTFGSDFVVGETLVKKGTYKVAYNLETKELTVIDKNDAVVAKTAGHVEARQKTTFGMEVVLAQKGENQALIRLAFPGDSRNIVVDANGSQAAMADK